MQTLVPTVTRTLSVTGPADPDVVWTRYAQPGLWPTWAPHLTSVTCSTPLIEPGSRGTVRAVGVVPTRFEITEVRPGDREWAWSVRCGPVRMALRHDVTASGSGTRAGVSVTGPAGVVDAYLPVAWWALHRLVAR